MIVYALGLLASLLGGISARQHFDFGLQLTLNTTAFSTVLTLWPFIVVLVLLLLVIMWYQTLKMRQRRRKQASRRPAGTNSLVFLGLVSAFVLVILASPYYLKRLPFASETETLAPEDRIELVLTVHGMDCGGCEALIQKSVGALVGIETVEASHVQEEVRVVYDKQKTSLEEIAQTIEKAGYTVVLE